MDGTQILEKVKEYQQNMTRLEQEHARLAGQRDAVLQQMQAEFGFTTMEEAEAHIEELTAEATQLETQLAARMGRLSRLLGNGNAG